MSRIENTSKLIIIAQKCIGLVDEHSRAPLFHDTEQGRRRDIGRRQGARGKRLNNAQRGCLPTAFYRRDQAEDGGNARGVMGMRMNHPQRQDGRRAVRQNGVPRERARQCFK